MTQTLYDLIDHADAIEIDGHFIRYFGLESEELDSEDDIVLHVETVDDDCNAWEWFFTVSDLEHAVYDAESKDWTVQMGDDVEPYTVTIYSVKPIAVIG